MFATDLHGWTRIRPTITANSESPRITRINTDYKLKITASSFHHEAPRWHEVPYGKVFVQLFSKSWPAGRQVYCDNEARNFVLLRFSMSIWGFHDLRSKESIRSWTASRISGCTQQNCCATILLPTCLRPRGAGSRWTRHLFVLFRDCIS